MKTYMMEVKCVVKFDTDLTKLAATIEVEDVLGAAPLKADVLECKVTKELPNDGNPTGSNPS